MFHVCETEMATKIAEKKQIDRELSSVQDEKSNSKCPTFSDKEPSDVSLAEPESGDTTDSLEFSDHDSRGDLKQGQAGDSQDLEGEDKKDRSAERKGAIKCEETDNVAAETTDVKTEKQSQSSNDVKKEGDDQPAIQIKEEKPEQLSSSAVVHTEPPAQPPPDQSRKTTRSDFKFRHTRSARFPNRPGIVWREGAKLEAQDYQDKWYMAKIMEIDASDDTVLIHFDGWNSRFDEWMPMSSERLRPIPRHSERTHTRSKSNFKAEYKLGQCVFAKWTDCRMYPGKIEKINANGSYEILFYDGFKKTVQPINIKTMPPEVKQQYAKAGLLPEPGKKNKFPIREIAKEIQEKKKELKDKKDEEKKSENETDETSEETEGKRLGEKRRKSIEAAIALKKSKLEGEKIEKKERRSSREGRIKETREKREPIKQKPAKEAKTSQSTGKKDGEKTPKQTSRRPSVNSPQDTLTTEPPAEVYKCPFSMCTKSFRKQSNVDYHVKYFHTQDGTPVQPPAPRKRTKTTSVCSEDSELSLSTSGGLKGSGKKQRKRERTSSELHTVPLEDDVISNADTKTTTTEEYQAELYPTELSQTEDGGQEDDERIEKIEKDEVVNCICQINEENGLMIQCDVCLCWQHALCMELTQDTLPAKYMCVVCTNPPGVRDSARFSYDQDWLKHGVMQSFSFLPPDVASASKAEMMRSTHGLVSDVLNVNGVLKATELQLDTLQKKHETELNVWRRIAEATRGPVSASNVPAANQQELMPETPVASTSSDPGTSRTNSLAEDPLTGLDEAKKARTKKDGEDPDSPESTHTDSTVSAEETPMSSEDHLLHYVDTLHDTIEARLDLIEEQIARLEAAEEQRAGEAPNGDEVLKDLPKVKKSLHYILSDLGKVRRLSFHHS